MRVAIVGCGKIADGHVDEVQKLGARAEIVGLCDRELLMAKQLGERFGVRPVYDDFDRMLADTRPDVVHITTPPDSHLPLTKRAIASGAHVFVEKPLTLDYASSKALVDHVEAAKKKLTIGYAYFLDQPALEIRDLIASGLVGDVVHVESFYGYDLAGPFGRALLGDASHWVHHLPGKLFQNTIDHPFSKIIEFIPDDEPEVHAFGHAQRAKRFGDTRDDLLDELRVLVRGKRVTAYLTFSSHIRPAAHFVRIYGTKNTIHADYTSRTVLFDPKPSLPSAIGRVVPAFEQAARYAKQGVKNATRFAKNDFHFFAGLSNLLSRFYDSIEHDRPPPIAYRDILRIAKMMDSVFTQVGQGSMREERPS
jgi:predicted dehydrogenase